MLNNDKIKLMTKLALYEQSNGKKSLPASKYYKDDYLGLKLINSAIVATLAFLLTLVCIVFVNIETLIYDITTIDLVNVGRIVIVCYIAFMVLYLTISYIVYKIKYNMIKDEVKEYDDTLKALYGIYKTEGTLQEALESGSDEEVEIAIMEEN